MNHYDTNLNKNKNFNAFSSSAKHQRLMRGEEIELSEVPKELKSHLESAESKSKKGSK